MQTKRKPPMRMCVGCGEMKPKAELLRIVRQNAGSDTQEQSQKKYNISVDPVGKMPGRGAYICKDTQCLAKARRSKRLERTFDCSIDDPVFEQLEKEMSANG